VLNQLARLRLADLAGGVVLVLHLLGRFFTVGLRQAEPRRLATLGPGFFVFSELGFVLEALLGLIQSESGFWSWSGLVFSNPRLVRPGCRSARVHHVPGGIGGGAGGETRRGQGR